MTRQAVLQTESLHAAYDDALALRDVSLAVPAGGIVTLLGRNGMGKTTLVRAIMNLRPPKIASGKILYNDTNITGLTPHRIAGLGLGLVPQGRRIFSTLSVLENLRIAQRGPKRPEISWSLDEVLDLFPVLRDRPDQAGGTLSGGEQQMLAIGRALMTCPDLLLLDEPTEGLAPAIIQGLRTQLLALKDRGCAVLLVEQRVDFALAVADEAYILERGSVVYHGTAAELASDDESRSRFLGVSSSG